jgi:ATP-dependent DNA helicase RecG
MTRDLPVHPINACDVLRASNELRTLRDKELISQKGKGKATYYIAGNNLNTEPLELNTYGNELNTYGNELNTYGEMLNTEPQSLKQELPSELREKIDSLGERENDSTKIKNIIYELCSLKSYTLKQIALILNRKENYTLRNYIVPMREEGKLQYTIPDMPKHPDQAYISI